MRTLRAQRHQLREEEEDAVWCLDLLMELLLYIDFAPAFLGEN